MSGGGGGGVIHVMMTEGVTGRKRSICNISEVFGTNHPIRLSIY